jgi:hypothetical protein
MPIGVRRQLPLRYLRWSADFVNCGRRHVATTGTQKVSKPSFRAASSAWSEIILNL